MSPRRIAAFVAALMCALFVIVAVQAQTPPAAKKEHAFKGKVEKVDEKGKMVTVNNENIPGWMMSMTMTYKVDKEAVLKDAEGRRQHHRDGLRRRLPDAVQHQGRAAGEEVTRL